MTDLDTEMINDAFERIKGRITSLIRINKSLNARPAVWIAQQYPRIIKPLLYVMPFPAGVITEEFSSEETMEEALMCFGNGVAELMNKSERFKSMGFVNGTPVCFCFSNSTSVRYVPNKQGRAAVRENAVMLTGMSFVPNTNAAISDKRLMLIRQDMSSDLFDIEEMDLGSEDEIGEGMFNRAESFRSGFMVNYSDAVSAGVDIDSSLFA